MAANWTTHQSGNGEWSFRFISSDGRLLACGESFLTREDMKPGIEQAKAVLRLAERDPKAAAPRP